MALGYETPKGEEKVVCKKLIKIYERLKRFSGDLEAADPSFSFNDFGINVNHAKEGVRVNGRETLITILDAYRSLQSYKKGMDRAVVTFKQAQIRVVKALSEAEKLMDRFCVCPKCGGHKGTKKILDEGKNKGFTFSYQPKRKEWVDCAQCNGRGIILRKSMERKVDSVDRYSRALSQTEITKLYKKK